MQPDPAIPLATRAPPRISRRILIGGALAAGFLLLLLCIIGGVGMSWLAGVGPLAKQAGVVGKWGAAGVPGTVWEFKADGTGHGIFGPNKWRMEPGSVCVVDHISMGRQFRYHVKFENGNLLLSRMDNPFGGPDMPPEIYHRIK
jgi:hypothetical protein